MAGVFSQALDALVKKGLKTFIEQIWPIVKYLIEHQILIPLVALVGIGYGVHLGHVTGDVGAGCFVLIIGIVSVSRILGKKKGESK